MLLTFLYLGGGKQCSSGFQQRAGGKTETLPFGEFNWMAIVCQYNYAEVEKSLVTAVPGQQGDTCSSTP